VRPVLRFTPARKAENRTASKAKWVRRPSWERGLEGAGGIAVGRGRCTTMMDVL
jgi:hypothetical protein